MHALLEQKVHRVPAGQVVRNCEAEEGGDSVEDEGAAAAATAAAAMAIDAAFGALAAGGEGGGGAVLREAAAQGLELHVVLEGDHLAAAAHGLTTGFVHGAAAMPRGCADGGGGAGGEPGAAGAGMFGLSDADVDAAEARMLRLALGTAAGPAGTVENNDDGGGAAAAAAGVVWRSLERGRLQAACGEGLAAATAERQQLLAGFAALLPPRGAEAHAGGVLARRHMEQLPERVLSQPPPKPRH
ncbi:hypothetical protein MNEG_14909 [Monoraphidium neglectum]|uniref:Uncharacterized protein n=1 Tax=Monoraphidium neglectum TaxID=145388 RepID=A0A0D2KAM1_9CHLO|nr:hypothetical protein MNEG_14909 [Monoraphidium neglectum]KIY93053.1 hypothetical protein MNEG_14909 [Monoraphidium neglectum]|eukprot:XP_013892073.1 hypothetical protein MNEG_14909 [Monoraphidium neglectum]